MSEKIRQLEARVEELERELIQLKQEIEELKRSSLMVLKPQRVEYTTAETEEQEPHKS
ncbi:MAG: hypothetical protein OXT74_19380 [Candidatus Poribacteria bacterium]|nr:hypothetical protein [Candidatus Poribacteria bacterium]